MIAAAANALTGLLVLPRMASSEAQQQVREVLLGLGTSISSYASASHPPLAWQHAACMASRQRRSLRLQCACWISQQLTAMIFQSLHPVPAGMLFESEQSVAAADWDEVREARLTVDEERRGDSGDAATGEEEESIALLQDPFLSRWASSQTQWLLLGFPCCMFCPTDCILTNYSSRWVQIPLDTRQSFLRSRE